MKKTEAAKAAAAAAATSASTTPTNSATVVASSASSSSKVFRKALSRSPNLQRKPDNGSKIESGSGAAVPPAVSGLVSGVNRAFTGSGTLHPPGVEEAVASPVAFSVEDLDTVDGSSGRENGSETQTTTAHSDEGSVEGHLSDSSDRAKTVAAIEHLKLKIMKTRDLIRLEQEQKESNVNEYLHLAASADKQQNQRIKTVFEKRNQKSAQSINHLQKKLEQYQKRLADIEMHGIPGHKQAKEVLRDVGQGLNTIVSKPREFAHLIKNRFGSADNIAQMKMDENVGDSMGQPPARAGNTLPASFKYTSDDDNSSELSGSGCGGLQGSPQFMAQTPAQALSAHQAMAAEMGPLREDVALVKDSTHRLEESMGRLLEEFDSYKSVTQSEVSNLRSLLEEEKFKVERLEEQINDLTELHQNEMANCKQDMASMEEKIEYRLDERITDLNDLVDNCQTRIHRLEQQQQQQQLLSMEMVENVTFRTILTKLINVVLALLAVVLVFVSTAANLLSPFITSRMRILWTGGLVLALSILYAYSSTVAATISYLWDWISQLLPFR